ncbi:hypothetical protein [Dactylosporangium sp. NPDC006015]|uniref:hypothetical protein n=1 Tax=Dactylosporangium sp. NPDC006015 TaxID=3154576 RepID=UPI0033A66A24
MTNPAAIRVMIELTLATTSPTTSDDFHQHVEAFTDELMDLEESDATLSDTSVAGDARTKVVTVDLCVMTEDHLEALIKASTATRTALHALGDGTSGWPTGDEIAHALSQANVQTEAMATAPC